MTNQPKVTRTAIMKQRIAQLEAEVARIKQFPEFHGRIADIPKMGVNAYIENSWPEEDTLP